MEKFLNSLTCTIPSSQNKKFVSLSLAETDLFIKIINKDKLDLLNHGTNFLKRKNTEKAKLLIQILKLLEREMEKKVGAYLKMRFWK